MDLARARPSIRHAGALLVLGAVFGLLLLPKLLPTEPGRVLSNSPADASILLWSLGWWPHAILHGQNPFATTAIWAPDGVNLAWTTTVPGLALLFSPLTLIAGPVISYNVVALRTLARPAVD